MLRRVVIYLAALSLAVATVLVGGTVFNNETPAHADGCYTWGRTLSEGDTGSDVRQLQIRVAGWVTSGEVLAIDGVYGPRTKAAVTRFQRGYGLSADGIAGSQTFGKIYDLQDNDCTPIHFTYGELNRCNSDWSGGKVSASTARSNALRNMWKLEAMRHKLGDRPIYISSGFRSIACNNAVGGASNSQHLYGRAADLTGSHSLCTLARAARSSGFAGILGPGYPGHNDHTHLDSRSSRFWSAPSCGI